MTGNEIRTEFLRYFESKGHAIVPSSPLVPYNDPTLLFTNAGMNQFKDVFLGLDHRPYTRATTAQKCVRAGGKHNDLDTVGRTARHHTFFEMLGNFSFGDYFKKDAIAFAWEFLTGVLKLSPQRLWVTIYRKDDEAFNLWQEVAGVPGERIIRMGEKDNFWAMGDTGPCGPCSEIIYDRGPEFACERTCALGVCDCDRWLEIWNLVFMQYDRSQEGRLTLLPRPSIDTGMGLERIASVLQGVPSNFDTDLIRPLIAALERLTGSRYSRGASGFPYRVIADHARACTFLIGDGVLPGNEGRSYVLRRILRRAARFGLNLGLEKPFLHLLVPEVVHIMGRAYPEVAEKAGEISRVIRQEEERFAETLSEGLKILSDMLKRAQDEGRSKVSGQEAFMLYDTYGFPLDLTEEIAAEKGYTVDREGFDQAMEAQRERARAAREDVKAYHFALSFAGALEELGGTVFTGYETLEHEGRIVALVREGEQVGELAAGNAGYAVCDRTPFYPEGGGQIGDQGSIIWPDGRAAVRDTLRLPDGKIIHQVMVERGILRRGMQVTLEVDADRRLATARNHTATHLLHRTLKQVLGEHANQAGSLVAPERLRFDFHHFAPLTGEELAQIESEINRLILADLPVKTFETSLAAARAMGATALFGEKYSDQVRVVQIGKVSMELCGGTHLKSTGAVGVFRLLSEAGIGSGLRRIEAVTGTAALEQIRQEREELEAIAALFKASPQALARRVEALQAEFKEAQRELAGLRRKLARYEAAELAAKAQEVKGIKVVPARVELTDPEAMREMAELTRDKLGSGVVVLGSANGERVHFVAMISKDLVSRGLHAGNLLREVARIASGGGGGRADMAQAGGRDPGKLDQALAYSLKAVSNQLG